MSLKYVFCIHTTAIFQGGFYEAILMYSIGLLLAMNENLESYNACVSLIHSAGNHPNCCPKSPSLCLLHILWSRASI